jgi:hypothetical protein
MVRLTNGTSDCAFVQKDGLYYIAINSRIILPVKKEDFGNYDLLSEVYDKWREANYPSFWRNPFRWLFGGPLRYDISYT